MRVFILDDNDDYVRPLFDRAEHVGIKLEHYRNLEDARNGVEELPSNYYQACILDGKGQLSSEHQLEDIAHLPKAIQWIDELDRKGVHLIRVINTGFYNDIQQLYPDEKVFDKIKHRATEVFEYIRDVVGRTNRAKQLFSDVYEIFELNLLDEDSRLVYMRIVSDYDKGNWSNARSIASDLRGLQEAVYANLSEMYPDVIPSESLYTNRKSLDIKRILEHLQGSTGVNGTDFIGWTMASISRLLYSNTSELIHYKSQDGRPFVATKYSLVALINLLNEFLLWYKDFVFKMQKTNRK